MKSDRGTENTSDAISSPRSALDSFLHDLIRQKKRESEAKELHINIQCDDAHGSEGGVFREKSARIGRSNSDPLSLKQSVLDVSDHTKRVSRWLSVPPSSSHSKQKLSNYMVRQPMRVPSKQRINAACSA